MSKLIQCSQCIYDNSMNTYNGFLIVHSAFCHVSNRKELHVAHDVFFLLCCIFFNDSWENYNHLLRNRCGHGCCHSLINILCLLSLATHNTTIVS